VAPESLGQVYYFQFVHRASTGTVSTAVKRAMFLFVFS